MKEVKTKNRPGIKLTFNQEYAHLFLKFAVHRGLSGAEIVKGEKDMYHVRFNTKNKQDAFDLGAGWHFFMKQLPNISSFTEWVYDNKLETLENTKKINV